MLSFDFLICILILLMVGGALVSFGFSQAETSVVNGVKFKSEAYAIALGSAINHFAAINPEEGSFLVLNLSNPEPIGNHTLSGGWPAVGRVSFNSCNVSFSNDAAGAPKYLIVNFSFNRWDSGFDQFVVGKYPVVPNVTVAAPLVMNCSGTMKITKSANTLDVVFTEDA